jgi:hypothetical protein
MSSTSNSQVALFSSNIIFFFIILSSSAKVVNSLFDNTLILTLLNPVIIFLTAFIIIKYLFKNVNFLFISLLKSSK